MAGGVVIITTNRIIIMIIVMFIILLLLTIILSSAIQPSHYASSPHPRPHPQREAQLVSRRALSFPIIAEELPHPPLIAFKLLNFNSGPSYQSLCTHSLIHNPILNHSRNSLSHHLGSQNRSSRHRGTHSKSRTSGSPNSEYGLVFNMVKVMMNVTEVMVTFMWNSTIPTMTRMLNSYYSFPCTDVDSTVQSCTIYLPSIELDISALSNISSFYFLISFALSNCLAPPSDDDTLLLSVKFRYYSYYFLFRLILFRMTSIFPFRNGG